MRRLVIGLLIPAAVLLDLSIIPMLAVLGAPVSISAVAVAALALLGLLPEALLVAVVAGTLLDLLSAVAVGTFLIPLLSLVALFLVFSRFRLLLPQVVVVTLVMTGVGLVNSVPVLLATFDPLLLASSLFSSALLGTLLFPLFQKLFPKRDAITT